MIRVTAVVLVVAAAFLLGSCIGPILRTDPCRSDPYSESELFQRIAQSAVTVEAQGSLRGSGTVVLATPSYALVITCAHVISGESQPLFVIYRDRGERQIETARVVYADGDVDLALLRVDADLRALPMRVATHEPGHYERLYSISAPDGLAGQAAVHVLSDPDARPAWTKESGIKPGVSTYRLSGMTLPGSSGGTVANARGELVAVLQGWHELGDGKETKVAEIAFAIPRHIIAAFMAGYLAKAKGK